MSLTILRPLELALISCWLLWCLPAQAAAAQDGGTSRPGTTAAREGTTPARSAQLRQAAASGSDRARRNEKHARDLAFRYLSLWSAPKRVAPALAASFYAPAVTFHGQRRTLASVLAEKRRFAARWPDRTYRHRPETTQVVCDERATRCTVQSSFDFTAANPRQNRRAEGIGEHQLVVSFATGVPMIEAEDSRVIIRGHGNMTWLLDEKL